MGKKNKISRREVFGGGAWRGTSVGLVAAAAVAGVVAGAVLTRLLLRARADRRWDQQVDRLRAQGAL